MGFSGDENYGLPARDSPDAPVWLTMHVFCIQSLSDTSDILSRNLGLIFIKSSFLTFPEDTYQEKNNKIHDRTMHNSVKFWLLFSPLL